MIEFAPNPTGPAHLGSLRTYAAAWRLARDSGLPLCIRFDHQKHVIPKTAINGGSSPAWGSHLLGDLAAVGMPPDRVYYNDVEMFVDRVDERECIVEDNPLFIPGAFLSLSDARLVRIEKFAFFDMEPTQYESDMPDAWRHGGDVPMLTSYAGLPVYAYEVGGRWLISDYVSSLLYAKLRGVTTIVRSRLSDKIGLAQSVCAVRLGIATLPSVERLAVVVGDEGALSKSALGIGAEGTVAWALERCGPDALREAVLASLDGDDRPIIHFGEILP